MGNIDTDGCTSDRLKHGSALMRVVYAGGGIGVGTNDVMHVRANVDK